MSAMSNEERTGAFFDLDLTITDRDSFRYFLKNQYLHNFHRWRFLPQVFFWALMRKVRLVSLQTFKEKALVSLKVKEKAFIRKVGQSFFERNLLNILREKAVERIEWHKKQGHLVFIATSCPDIYILDLAEYLGCDGYECTKLAYCDDKFVGRFDARDCLGSEKVERIRAVAEVERLDLATSFAYSDHESDLPMLELVGNPVAISPTAKLREIATERGWNVEEW